MAITIVVEDEVAGRLLQKCVETLKTKGGDYTEGRIEQDRIANFRTAAVDIDIPMRKVWWVYFYKHLSSVKRYVKEGRVESEALEGRILDLVNYLLLFHRIVLEEQDAEQSAKFQRYQEHLRQQLKPVQKKRTKGARKAA